MDDPTPNPGAAPTTSEQPPDLLHHHAEEVPIRNVLLHPNANRGYGTLSSPAHSINSGSSGREGDVDGSSSGTMSVGSRHNNANNNAHNSINAGGLRRRVLTNQVATQPTELNLLSAKYESLDYETFENTLQQDEEKSMGYSFVVRKNRMRWIIIFIIGVLAALVACCIDMAVEELAAVKYSTLKYFVDSCTLKDCLISPYFLWVAMNAIPVCIGSIMVSYGEPAAAGSGIPMVKCYLNGVKVPHVVRFKTLVIKAIGVALSVAGGLAVGKEGPMIHSGAAIAAGVSQGKSTTFHRDFKILHYFRDDHEKRDFVAAGAAAGVAAAFGAPIGGVLFSLEEGASFWNQGLTWKIFFGSMVSAFTLNLVLSSYHGHAGDLVYAGLLNFGRFDGISYDVEEIPIFLVMAVIGGLLGAFYNYLNFKLTVFRIRYLYKPWAKVLEAVLVAAVTATLAFGSIILVPDCRTVTNSTTPYPVQLFCDDGQYNVMAALWFEDPESGVRALFHNPTGTFRWYTLAVFAVLYFILGCWTYGLSISSGLFIPTLLIGAAWGRLIGVGMGTLFPKFGVNPGRYALIGAAAQLGGVVRMTISLTVILMEATGSLEMGLPLMFVLLLAKFVGDFFNEGLYDTHIQLAGVPILPWEPPPLSGHIFASEVMSHPVVAFQSRESVQRIVEVLKSETFNGFPVVDPEVGGNVLRHMGSNHHVRSPQACGRLRGMILRWQLIVLLQHKIYEQNAEEWQRVVSVEMFRDAYPRYPVVEHILVSPTEMHFTIDLRPFMNQSPYSVGAHASLPRIFVLFRALGLRHLMVVDDDNEVVGMVTRKDLARFRLWEHRGHMGLEELLISSDRT